MAAHRPHPITTEHFVQWLELWRATADEILAPEHAELLHEYAGRIARRLRHGLGLPDDRTDAASGTRGSGRVDPRGRCLNKQKLIDPTPLLIHNAQPYNS